MCAPWPISTIILTSTVFIAVQGLRKFVARVSDSVSPGHITACLSGERREFEKPSLLWAEQECINVIHGYEKGGAFRNHYLYKRGRRKSFSQHAIHSGKSGRVSAITACIFCSLRPNRERHRNKSERIATGRVAVERDFNLKK